MRPAPPPQQGGGVWPERAPRAGEENTGLEPVSVQRGGQERRPDRMRQYWLPCKWAALPPVAVVVSVAGIS